MTPERAREVTRVRAHVPRTSRALVVPVTLVLLVASAGCRPIVAWFGRDPERITLVEVLERRGRQRVVVDGVAGNWYDAVGVAALVFTADGHVAYPVRVGDRWHVVHDGRLGPPHDGVGEVLLSPDGTRSMYAAADGDLWTVRVEEREQGHWTALGSGSLRLVSGAPRAAGDPSPRWSFVGYRGEHAFVVVDGEVAGPFDVASPALLDARRSAFATVRNESARVFVDGVPGASFAQVRDLQLVEGRVAYLGHSSAGSVVVLEGTVGGEHPALRHLRVHPSGRWLAIRSETTTPEAPEALVLGTADTFPEDRCLPVVDAVQQATLLSDARVVWIGVEATHAQVYVEGEAQARHASITALVTRGEHYAYVGERDGQHHVTVDGRPSAHEDLPIDSLVVTSEGAVAYHTQRRLDPNALPTDVVVARGDHWPAPGFLEGSLVCLSEAPHCAHLAMQDDALQLVVDGTHHVPFDLEEVVASTARSATRPALGDDAWLQAWLTGELRWVVATRQPPGAH